MKRPYYTLNEYFLCGQMKYRNIQVNKYTTFYLQDSSRTEYLQQRQS